MFSSGEPGNPYNLADSTLPPAMFIRVDLTKRKLQNAETLTGLVHGEVSREKRPRGRR